MCGIGGYIGGKLSQSIGLAMADQIKHRGPDHQEARVYQEQNCVLAHARLSIIDLSTAANQPMEYEDLAIVFNGEVYNFNEIRKELEDKGHQFRLHSDTEVILHAYKEWGTACVSRFIGMFAFAILDKGKDELFLFRDRAGVKPLYYYQQGETFIFASELKEMYVHPEFHKNIDMDAVALYFKFGYIPAPYAIFENVRKLKPGHYLNYDIAHQSFTIHQYWNVMDYYEKPKLDISYSEAKDELRRILQSAFEYRMVADVPVGVFLSGGYDSVGVTAMLQKERTEKLKTFTIGFPVGNNEAPIAKEISDYLGTDHTEYTCTYDDCKAILPELAYYYDEPFSDNSAVPTILVSKLARKKVKVALSADAGDETFAGYNSYASLANVLKFMSLIKNVKSGLLSNVVMNVNKMVSPYSYLREKVEYFGKMLRYDDCERVSVAFEGGGSLMESLYSKMLRLPYPQPMFLMDERKLGDAISVATAIDYVNYLPNNILVKVDRAAMSVSLEGREPLLDHRIIEFAAQLPTDFKFKDGVKKRIWRDIVHDYVPKEIMNRPKTGFTMPIYDWLKADLRYLVEENLNDTLDESIFNRKFVKKLKTDFFAGKLGHEEKVVWRLIAFQLWWKTNMK